MRKIGAVIRREFIERVRSRWFWVSSLVVPAVFGALMFLPAALATSGAPKRVVVVDATADLGTSVADALEAGGAFHATRVPDGPGIIDSLVLEVSAKRLDGFVVLTEDALTSGTVQYRASNVSSLRDIGELRRAISAGHHQVVARSQARRHRPRGDGARAGGHSR